MEMAPKPPAYQALLELEKGTPGSPIEQIKEAARIAGIDLDDHITRCWKINDLTPSNPPANSAPKEEWVLRWLLKKLKTSTEGGNAFRQNVGSWILLRILLDLLPPRSLALMLNENGFVGILKDALVQLNLPPSTQGGNEALGGGSDSASNTQKKPESELPTRNRKRKRVEDDKTICSETDSQAQIKVFLSILESLGGYMRLTNKIPRDQASLKAQLKLVLRAEPETLAIILGRACSHANVSPWILSVSESPLVKQHMFSTLSTILDIWSIRSDGFEDDSAKSSNASFVSHALVDILGLIQRLNSCTNDLISQRGLVVALERLVALHVVLPIRETFLSAVSTKTAETNPPTSLEKVQLVLSDLDSRLNHAFPTTNHSLFPVLFDISIRSLPRNTFRRQINEDPWLEILAIALLSKAGYSAWVDKSVQSGQQETGLLEQLLRVAIHRKLKFSLETLVQCATSYSGLLEGKQGEIKWDLIAHILRLGDDVFLLNSGLEQSSELLNALIKQITFQYLQPSQPISNQLHNLIKHDIAIPLTRAFFNARDGPALLKIWMAELKEMEMSRQTESLVSRFSVWEDDDLLKAYGDLLSSHMSNAQIKTQANDMLSALINKDLALSYSPFVVLDAILMSPSKGALDAPDVELYEKIFNQVAEMVQLDTKIGWSWRLWRIAQNSVNRYPSHTEYIAFHLGESLVPKACRQMASLLNDAKPIPNQCLEAYWCLNFVACAASKAESDSFKGQLSALVETIFSQKGDILLKRDIPAWDGRMETITAPSSFLIGSLIVLLAKPKAAIQLSAEAQRCLFETILSCFKNTKSPAIKSQLNEIWNSFVSPDWLLRADACVNELVSVIIAGLKEEGCPSQVLICGLLSIPTRLIRRHQRGLALDLLLTMALEHRINTDTKLNVLLLITRLAEASKSQARLTTNPEEIWALASSINLDETDNHRLLFDTFQQLYAAVTERFITSSEENALKYLKKTYAKVNGLKNLVGSPNFATMEYFVLVLSIQFLTQHIERLANPSKTDALLSLRQKAFDAVTSELQSLKKSSKSSSSFDENKLLGILYVLDASQQLLVASKDARKNIRKLEEYMAKHDCSLSIRKSTKLRTITFKTPSIEIESRLVDCSSLFSIKHLLDPEQRSLIQRVKQQLTVMNESQLVELIQSLCAAGFVGEGGHYRLLLLDMLMLELDPIRDRDSPASASLCSAFTQVSSALSQCGTIEQLCLTLEFLNVYLRTQAKSVTQWHIDNLLANIAIVLSLSGPQIDPKFASTIYTRLCNLLGTVFGLYRQKLSGRFQLLLPIMQALLRCLFNQDQTRPSGNFKGRLDFPPWMGRERLQPEHSTQYSRLLGALCDPTVSSVQRNQGGHHSTAQLHDNTKKVKSLAGQYLQYLIMEYTGCQLRGYMSPEMKTALMPGMYIILDVMSQSTMRAMNSALDSSGRAVFKSLYDNYIRFGKWNHE
ncbi:hypothetical protein FQN57_004060 [Myotisia sp. PD_48]|nr:hypothetical protein FQN57_004060 [Myotisia sp. PD_48]